MDVQLPGIDGIEATRRITAAGDGAPRVLVLTTFDVDEYVVGSVQAGASGFLLKRARAERIVEAVRLVADGEVLPIPARTAGLIAAATSGPVLVRRAVRPAAHRPRGGRADPGRRVACRTRRLPSGLHLSVETVQDPPEAHLHEEWLAQPAAGGHRRVRERRGAPHPTG